MNDSRLGPSIHMTTMNAIENSDAAIQAWLARRDEAESSDAPPNAFTEYESRNKMNDIFQMVMKCQGNPG